MQRLLFLVVLILSIFNYFGCVAPGSSVGRVSIDGTLVSVTDEPIPDKEIQIILPAAYGLGRLDLIMNKPDDFGHKDEQFFVITDSARNFHYVIGDRLYHVSCWWLPPVGCFPKRPPAPFLLVRLSDSSNEYYAIETYNGEFKVYSLEGNEIPLADSSLLEIVANYEPDLDPKISETIGKIKLKVKSE